MRLRTLILLTFFANLAAYGQKPAPMELGFQADKVYDFGSIESVNAFNGNLIVSLPIGMRYPVATGFDFGLTLTYNGKIWDYYSVQPYENGNFYAAAKPNLRSNAGDGWRVSLGRLLAPSEPTQYGYTDEPTSWTYESPSGDDHPFFSVVYNDTSTPCGTGTIDSNATVQFTCDGSHLRLVKIDSTTRQVHFPDGRIHEFKYQHNAWLLSKMKDSTGNTVTVGSSFDDDGYLIEVGASDGNGRTVDVHYRNLPEMGDSIDHGQNVDYIDFTASGTTATVRYTFNYSTVDVPVGPHDTFTGSGLPQAPSCGTINPCTIAIPLLTSIDLPDSQDPTRNHFTFSYATAGSSTETYSQGLLIDLQLPTGGHHAYAYQRYALPPVGRCDPTDARSDTPGIKTKTIDGHTWTYSLASAGSADLTGTAEAGQCKDPEGTSYPFNWPYRWTRTSIISPPDDATGKSSREDHYFSIFGTLPLGMQDSRLHADYWSCNCTTSLYLFGYPGAAGWPGSTQARLLTPGTPECAGGNDCDGKTDDGTNTNTRLSMTSQTYDGCTSAGDCSNGTLLRTAWTRYTGASKADLAPTVSERTVLEDDTSCGTSPACYQQMDKSDSDNAGHFRTEQLSSNYAGHPGDSKYVGYPTLTNTQANTWWAPWVLETFTEKKRTIGTSVDRTQYYFNTLGQILLTRKLASTDGTVGAHDVITEFLYLGADVSDMKSYGGDYQAVDTSDLASITLPSQPEYWSHYGYSYGVLASEQSYTSNGTPMPFLSLDRTIETKTGLVTASKSTDALTTSYEYQPWGALKKVTPPGEAWTTYTYTPATYGPGTISANATVVATTADNTNPNYKTVTYSYDGLGRLFKTSHALPGVSCAEQIIGFDNNGRRATESIWKTCGGSGGNTTTRYDGLGRVISVTTPDNKVSSVSYTGARHIDRTVSVAEKSGDHNVIQGEDYDVFGRLVKVTNPLLTGSYQYDIGDRLWKVDVSAPSTMTVQSRVFTYDNRGFLQSEQHPELGSSGGGTATYQHFAANGLIDQGYDSRGHSHYKNTGSAFTLFTSFDKAERVTTVTDGSSHVLKQFTYDSTDGTQCPSGSCNGKVSVATRLNPAFGSVQTTEYYRYDGVTGRPSRRDTNVNTVGSFNGLTFSFSQQYNAIGAVKKVTYPCHIASANGSCIDTPLTVGYNYTNGVLSSIDDGAGFPATIWSSSITYQPNGLIADVVHGNAKMHEKWTPDVAGMSRPGVITARNGSDTLDLWSTGWYEYDGAGNIKWIGNTSYVYDDLEQLRTATNAVGTSFNATTTNYDAFGNILSTTQSYCGNNIRCGSTTSLTRSVDSAHNHYTDMTYDSAGNVTVDGHRTLTYDALGVTSSIAVSGRTFFYLYNADDERVAIVESKGSGFNRTTYTLRGFGNQVLRSYVDNYFSGSENFSRKEDEIWRGDRLLAIDNGAVRHYVLDHLGSPRFLADVNGAPVGVGTQTFSPWGVGGTTNGGMLQFTGHERDAFNVADSSGSVVTTDLPDYDHARLYDPYEAHFCSVDPSLNIEKAVRELGRWNRYVYAVNDPVRFSDPTGREHVQEPGFTKPLSQAGGWADYPAVSWAFYAEGALFGVAGGYAGYAVVENLALHAMVRLATMGGGAAATAEGLRRAAESEGPTERVVTNLTRAPQEGRALSAAVGENAQALANAARPGAKTFVAQIPKTLINGLRQAGLLEVRTTVMNGIKGTEYRFSAEGAQYVTKFFKLLTMAVGEKAEK